MNVLKVKVTWVKYGNVGDLAAPKSNLGDAAKSPKLLFNGKSKVGTGKTKLP